MFTIFSNVRKLSNSVTTIYRSKKLPRESIIDKYKEKNGKVYCTSKLQKAENIEKYGIVKHTFDIINETVETENLANATEI